MSRSYKLSLADGKEHRVMGPSKTYRGGRKLARKHAHHQERRRTQREIQQEVQS